VTLLRQALSEPLPGGVCRVCEERLPEGSLRCVGCGAVYGEKNRCPSCRAVAAAEPSVGLGRCRVCGHPRFCVQDAETVRTHRELPLLRRAERARRRAAALASGALGGAALGVLMLLLDRLSLAVSAESGFSWGLLLALFPLAASLPFAERARAARAEQRRLLDQARLVVAADVIASHGGPLEARDLAQRLALEAAQAELLVAQLSLDDFLRLRVSEAGELGGLRGIEPPPAGPAKLARSDSKG
jgi:hypothetical protein